MIETGAGEVRLSLLSPRATSRAAVPAAGYLISADCEIWGLQWQNIRK